MGRVWEMNQTVRSSRMVYFRELILCERNFKSNTHLIHTTELSLTRDYLKNPPPFPNILLTTLSGRRPHRGSGRLVRIRLDGAQVDKNTGIVGPIGARESHKRSRGSTASTCDLDLRARDVELGLVRLARHVKSNMFLDEINFLARG